MEIIQINRLDPKPLERLLHSSLHIFRRPIHYHPIWRSDNTELGG